MEDRELIADVRYEQLDVQAAGGGRHQGHHDALVGFGQSR